ncbi:MAG: sll1863 family stress response protein [Acidimicrobiia bacterium]
MMTTTEPGMEMSGHLREWEAKAEHAGREATQARLDAWRARIDELRVQAHLAGLDASDELAAPVARLELRLDHARDRLRQLARETDDVWTALSTAYASARDELRAGAQLIEERISTDSEQ